MIKNLFYKVTLLVAFFVLTGNALAVQAYSDAWFQGEGTQYGGVAGSNGGNCGIWVDSSNSYTCALNQSQYDSSSACGACIHAYGPLGDVQVQVVDRCPECAQGDIDFATGAFLQIATLEQGRVSIRWQFVPCALAIDDPSIHITVDSGTSAWYFKAMFDNLYVALASVDYLDAEGNWILLQREMYNYFIAPSGIEGGKSFLSPHTFRLTSVAGEQLVVNAVETLVGQTSSLGVQFSLPYVAASESVLSLPAAAFSVTRVEVFDVWGRRLAVMPQWNPARLPASVHGVLVVRQYASSGNVFTVKYVVP